MKSTRVIRIFSIILSFLIVIGIITISKELVLADTDATTGLMYTITDGTATITGFTAPTGFDGSLAIPGTLGGVSVTRIGWAAFSKCTSLTGITIPNSVISMEYNAFSGCSSLTSITVDAANTKYKSVDGFLLSKDGKYLIRCPEGKSGSITIPSGVTEISEDSFLYCLSLTNITISSSVTWIGVNFTDCSALTSITVNSANTVYKSMNGILYSKDGSKIILCPQGKSGSITIPSGVMSIEGGAFGTCKNLTSITIPSSVTSIGGGAFGGCTSLVNITIPNSVTSIGEWAFLGCTSLVNITIPNSVTSIGHSAFRRCTSLTNIAIPSSITSIGYGAFEYCTSLTNITIPSGVTSIGSLAFQACTSLTSITIPSSVTSMGSQAFLGCTNLHDAYFYGNAPTMGEQVFQDCATDFAIHYSSMRTGYSNPWYGYPAEPFAGEIAYQTHIQDIGWQAYVSNGEMSGTSAQSKRLEAIRIKLVGIGGSIEYRTHVQDVGWQNWVADDALSGTSGQSKRLEAIQIRLTGEAADMFDVYYRVHAQNTGWMDWAKNGASAGTAGFGYRMEAIEIKLILKGRAAPGSTARPFIDLSAPRVSYKTHVQDVGWQAYVSNGEMSGTSGQSLRLEAIQIKLENIAGGIEYRTHVQDIGWMDWVANDALSGTNGQSKRLEAIKIRLTGAAADTYDIYYCVHAQDIGWLDWAGNGESAGTAGFGYRLEAIKVVLVPKGSPAPGATTRAFVQG